MSDMSEACADLQDYLNRRAGVAYVGSFEAVASVMFPPRYDAHVRSYRAHRRFAEQTRQLAAGDAAVRAYLTSQGVRL